MVDNQFYVDRFIPPNILIFAGSKPANFFCLFRSYISLRAKRFTCFVEVYAIDTDGQSRFSDIIAFHPTTNDAYIIDPTIRYESSNEEQDKVVRQEKESIYSKCIPFYEEKYLEAFGTRNWSVRGLWFGGRGAIGPSVIEFFNECKLDMAELKKLSEEILMKTIHIINNHIYSN